MGTSRVRREDLATASPRRIRELCRTGSIDRPTSGAAVGFVQVNLVILRSDWASDFEAYCRANPKPCPLLEVMPPGATEPQMAPGADIRTDLPRYRVLRHGVIVDRPKSIESYWQEDLAAFLIGCSFTFESALIKAGLPVRHIEVGCNVPMYRTNMSCIAYGRFAGPMVVSMRPMTPPQAERAVRVTSEFPRAHGAPVHVGGPEKLGITDLHKPDYGDPVTLRTGEVPVFWACGVTPMEAILQAKPDLAITHDPGHMLVTDAPDESLREPSHPSVD